MSKRHDIQDATGRVEYLAGRGTLEAWGTGAPSNSKTGFAPGCIYHRVDGAGGTSLYLNEGTFTSSTWQAIGSGVTYATLSITTATIADLAGGVVMNEAGAAVGVRVESDTNANFFNISGTGVGYASFGSAVPTNPQALLAILPIAQTITANQSYYHQEILATGGAVTVPAGTAPLVVSLGVFEPNITATGTVTNAVTVYIANAPTEGGTGNYALWVDDGACRFDSSVVFGAAVVPTNPQAQVAILPQANASGVTANQNYHHVTLLATAGAVTIPAGTAPVVSSLNLHEPNITATGTVSDAVTLRIVDAPTEGTRNWALWIAAGAARLDGNVFMGGVTSNANITLGLTITQGANDDEILALKSSDVTHGVTGVTETDTYGSFKKFSANNGGLQIDGMCDTGSTGFLIRGVGVTADATHSNAGVASIILDSALKSTTTVATTGSTKNIVCFRDNGTTRHILDSDGNSYQDVGVAWTNFDDHNDLTLLNSMSQHLARPENPIKEGFSKWLGANKAQLERLNLVAFNEDTNGGAFVNMSMLSFLLVGAVRQLGQQLDAALAAVQDTKALTDRIARLERLLGAA